MLYFLRTIFLLFCFVFFDYFHFPTKFKHDKKFYIMFVGGWRWGYMVYMQNENNGALNWRGFFYNIPLYYVIKSSIKTARWILFTFHYHPFVSGILCVISLNES